MIFRNRLVVLSYHRVLSTTDLLYPEQITAEDFDMHLKTLTRFYRVFTLSDALSMLDIGRLPTRSVAITFDDGYADNATHALPLLLKYGLKATFFIATKFIAGGLMWNDAVIESIRNCNEEGLDLGNLGLGHHRLDNVESRRQAINKLIPKLKHVPEPRRSEKVRRIVIATKSEIPDRMMMTGSQLRTLVEAGMEIGAHTVSHPILATQPDDEAKREIIESRHELSQLLGVGVNSFAYPNGRPGTDYNDKHARFVRDAGYSAAVSTRVGIVTRDGDRFELPRFNVWDKNYLKFWLRMMQWSFRD